MRAQKACTTCNKDPLFHNAPLVVVGKLSLAVADATLPARDYDQCGEE
jgi:hypothetical protein